MTISEEDIEDSIYTQVAEELERNEWDKGLQVKAAAQAKGDANLAKSLYIQLRVQQLARRFANAVEEQQEKKRREAKEAASGNVASYSLVGSFFWACFVLSLVCLVINGIFEGIRMLAR